MDSPAKYNNFQNLKSLAYIHEERCLFFDSNYIQKRTFPIQIWSHH